MAPLNDRDPRGSDSTATRKNRWNQLKTQNTDGTLTGLPLSAWKLDEDRTHLCDEICSGSGFLDVLRFLLWCAIGYYATRWLNLGFEKLDASRLIELIQSICMGLSLGGILGAFYIRNWWILGLCVGGAMRLIQRDLDSDHDWNSCGIGHVRGTYTWNQKFVQYSSPFAALWFVVTSEALDRICNLKKTCGASDDDNWKYVEYVFGRPSKHLVGAPQIWGQSPQGKLLVLGVESVSNEKPLDLDFYGLYEAEDSDSESEHSESSDFESKMRKEHHPGTSRTALSCIDSSSEDLEESVVTGEAAKELEGVTVMLIYSPDGHHVLEPLSVLEEDGEWHLRLAVPQNGRQDRNQYRKILKAGDAKEPILLFIPSESRQRPPMLLSTDASTMQRRHPITLCTLCILPVLLLGICAAVQHGSSFSALFLVLPDLAEAVLHRGWHAMTNMPDIWHKGWSCVHGSDQIRTEVALFTSTFFFVGCQAVLVLACYHLHVAKNSLHALNDLLLFYNQEEPEYQALLLQKLYQIRERVSNKRCLRHFASHAFPQSLKPDKSLIWWFQTRAALFADIKFNLEKRNVILLLCLFLSLASGLLAATAHFSQDKFSNMCYAVAHGLVSAIILLVYVVLGNLVNIELQSGMDQLQRLCMTEGQEKPEDTDADGALSRQSSRSVAARLDEGFLSPLRSNPKPEPEQVCRHLVQYSMHKPYSLKFFCFTLTMGCVSVAATPLLSIAGGLMIWALKRAGLDFVEYIT